HLIREVDIETGAVTTLTIEGLAPLKESVPQDKELDESKESTGSPAADDGNSLGDQEKPAEDAATSEQSTPEKAPENTTAATLADEEITEEGVTEEDVAGDKDGDKKDEAPPAVPKSPNSSTKTLKNVTVKPADGSIKVAVKLALPTGWKLNKLAPMSYFVTADGPGPVPIAAMGKKKLKKPAAEFEFDLPIESSGEQKLVVTTTYFYCQEADEGICKIGSIIWKISAKIDDQGKNTSIELVHQITD
ncbi:MAG: hypothetical protein ACI9HK_005300, partial [Pirellulaceae bacterium]